MITQRNLDEVSIDIELQQLGTYIAHKICELNRTLQSITSKHRQKIKAAVCTVVTTDTNNVSEEIQYTENISGNSDTPCEISQESNDEKEKNEEKENEKENEEENNNNYSPFIETIHSTDESSDSN